MSATPQAAIDAAAKAGTDAQWFVASHAHDPGVRRQERAAILAQALRLATPCLQAFPRCPTPCDGDCEQSCHEVHEIPSHRDHNPETCVATVVSAAVAVAVAAERERIRQMAMDHAATWPARCRGSEPHHALCHGVHREPFAALLEAAP